MNTHHRQRFVHTAAGVRLSVHTWGQPPSPAHPTEVVVLLHGFPDRAVFWQQVATHLSQDCHVVAYDMRGCGDSTPLQGTRHYRYAPLLDDLYAVIEAVSPHQPVHLVGHDWGALYGWDALFDARASQRVASFLTMAPSLDQVGWWMRRRVLRPTPHRLAQVLHQGLVSNGLMAFFTLPILPELLWRSGLASRMTRVLLKHLEGIERAPYPGMVDDAIRYLGIYRSNLLQRSLRPRPIVRTTIPVHALIAVRDPFLPPRVFEGCHEWTHQYSESTIDAAHWAPLSRPETLSEAIRRFTQQRQVAAA